MGRNEVEEIAYRGRQVRNKYPNEKERGKQTQELNNISIEDDSDLLEIGIYLLMTRWNSNIAPLGR